MTNVLVVGSGGREHTLAWKLRQSDDLGELYCAPGNAGTDAIATNLDRSDSDIDGILQDVERFKIDLIVVGPEAPLADGLADRLRDAGHLVFGPNAAAARIESSKHWAKEIMEEWGVPTGAARLVTSVAEAQTAINDAVLPVVIKADGLTTGKGVYICQSRQEALDAIDRLMSQEIFGEAGATVLVEEYLTGMEVSLLAVTDGETVLPLLPACDYKRVGDGDTGPNTGGMGAYCPPESIGRAEINQLVADIIQPTIDGIKARAGDYRGVLYAGLILTEQGPKVLEFNCRFGDPETQVVLPMLRADFLALCLATAQGELASLPPLEWSDGGCVAVVMASSGYPGSYKIGLPISGLGAVPESGIAFHAGTSIQGDEVVTSGGRVLAAVGTGASLSSARDVAYSTARAISFDGAFYRTDIGEREAG